MAKKPEDKTKKLKSLLNKLLNYANPEGMENDGCLGCGMYPEGDSHVIPHDDGCDWVTLRTEIEEL